MTTPDTTQLYHDQAKEFFEKTAPEKARQTKFVQRTSPINGHLFVLTLVLNVIQFGVINLDQLAKTAHQIDPHVDVTKQAFKERFTALAVDFLKAMFVEALKTTVPGAAHVIPLLSAFAAVYLLDSTSVPLPESLKPEFKGCGGAGAEAALKLYLLLNYLSGSYETMQLEAGRKADQNMGQRFLAGRPAGALWLFDLGFFNASFLAAIAHAGSFFVCRLAASQLTFWWRHATGELEPLDLDRLLRHAPRHLFEIEVVFGPQQQVVTRLISAPVPTSVAATRRRHAREAARRQGRTPTQRTLRRCDWTLLLTNAEAQRLPTSTVLEVYGVRWQVELAFKLFKSDAKLELTHATEKHRLQCELYAKLIALLLFNRLCGVVQSSLREKISPTKLWRRMRDDVKDLLKALGRGTAHALGELLKYLSRFALPSARKKYPSTLQRLQRAAHQAQHVTLKDPLGYLREKRKPIGQRSKVFAQYIEKHKIAFDFERLDFQKAA